MVVRVWLADLPIAWLFGCLVVWLADLLMVWLIGYWAAGLAYDLADVLLGVLVVLVPGPAFCFRQVVFSGTRKLTCLYLPPPPVRGRGLGKGWKTRRNLGFLLGV